MFYQAIQLLIYFPSFLSTRVLKQRKPENEITSLYITTDIMKEY